MSLESLPFQKSVIAMASAKGGVGKSTHSYNLGAYYHVQCGMNVLILDVEKQPALSEIAYTGKRVEGKRFDIKHYFDADALLDDIEMYKMRYDVIIIDTAGTDVDINSGITDAAQEAMNESAITAADFVVVPVKPSALDARKTLKFARSLTKWMKARRGDLQALCFLNEGRANENLTKEVHDQMKAGLPIEYLDDMISYSPYVGESMLYQMSVQQFKPGHNVAKQFSALADTIMLRVQAHISERGA
jgi:cellulose biosynthesis protein BcsQ